MDLFSRKIVGWAMRDHLRTESMSTALMMAVRPAHVERPAADSENLTHRSVYAPGYPMWVSAFGQTAPRHRCTMAIAETAVGRLRLASTSTRPRHLVASGVLLWATCGVFRKPDPVQSK
jgi:hypothetical protein